MTRIIAGAAGSLTLAVPDAGTRPTSDRVRESLFGALDAADLVDGAAVLDLYAGSGALGLEAVSRGAASADLVERAPRAASVAERNARAVARAVPGARVRVHRAAVEAFLRAATATFDLVFVDPPYELDDGSLSEALELLAPRLAPDAVVIVERATRSGAPELPESLEVSRERTYGDTTLWWVTAVASAEA
ncbi:MAG: 16S rRNA (guanine(966)-N(2))-methyltransferase RsmD [Microbacterium sp.]|nr:MAG: 16S rRNA (guanine(966)-N(2))-methyltransferase RsmD [Microbacterium sp.]